MSQIDQIKNYCRLASLCGASEAILGARKIGLFQAMDGPPKTLEELASSCNVPASRLALLLDVLVTTGAVEQYGDDYALSTAMRLANSQPTPLHGPHWQSLAEFLQDGQQDADHESSHHAFRGDAMSAQWTLTAAAMELAELLKIGEDRRDLSILDLGAGAAMWSIAMAYRDSLTRVTVMDVAPALEPARQTVSEIGLEDRVDFQPTDYRMAELPQQTYDMVLAVDLLQLQPLEKCRIWLEQAHQSLNESGELVLVSRFPGLPRGDLHRTLAALELAMRVPDAELHSAESIEAMLKSLGFHPSAPKMLDVPPYNLGAIVAARA